MIDVIIPTRNRVNTLKLVLPTYFKQELLGKIIIIDDASTDDLRNEVKIFLKDHPNLIYKRFDKRIYIPKARNEGLKLSSAEYIFMGEDDVFLEDNHLKILFEQLEKYQADLIAGRRIYIGENQSFQEAKENADKDKNSIFTKFPFEGYFERYFDKDIINPPYLHSNSLIKRRVFEKVLYDPWYIGNAFREDLDFFLNCLANDFKMVLTNKTSCYHFKGKINKKGGARLKRLNYEYYVWKNTFYCFSKNKKVLKEKLGIKFPKAYAFLSLICRYPYALYKRLK